MGGHSGLNISEDRGNAVALVTLVLQAVVKAHPDVRIISVSAGDKRNAIAREACAVLEVTDLLILSVMQAMKHTLGHWLVSHPIDA